MDDGVTDLIVKLHHKFKIDFNVISEEDLGSENTQATKKSKCEGQGIA